MGFGGIFVLIGVIWEEFLEKFSWVLSTFSLYFDNILLPTLLLHCNITSKKCDITLAYEGLN